MWGAGGLDGVDMANVYTKDGAFGARMREVCPYRPRRIILIALPGPMTQPLIPPFHLPPAYPEAGEVLDGKYQVERLLGEGGMGAVAKATHLLRRAPVALKFMSPAVMSMPGAVERFINEGVAASQIDSDHVVKIFDVGQLKTGAPYLVMEYMEGVDLSDLLAKEGTPGLPLARSVYFTVQTLRGLQVAHAAGIVHRDMKPSNCFVVEKDGEADFVKLLDFGISKVQQPGGGHITRTNSALGTPLYMSPEQARSPRDVDLRSDIYSVGVILYELLTGRTPFHSETGEFTEILFKIFTMDPPPVKTLRPDLPDGLCDVIHRALARDPKDRFNSATDMAQALGPWADERSHHMLSRMRNVASRMPSGLPPKPSMPPPQSIVPPALDARATPGEAMAKTQHSAGSLPPRALHASESDAPSAHLAGAPRTDIGVTRDAGPPATTARGGAKRSALVYGVPVALVVVLLGVGGAVAMRSRGATGTASADSASNGPLMTGAPPPPASVIVPALPPAPAASADASAPSPSSSTLRPMPNVSLSVTPPKPKAPVRPGDLGDLTGKQ